MAGFYLHAAGTVTVAASTIRTLFQITAPSDQKLRIRACRISTQGTAVSDVGCLVSFVRQTGAGTSSSFTLQKRNEMDTETIRSTALGTFSSTEPTTDKTYRQETIPAFSGMVNINFFATHGEALIINEGERFAITVSVPAGVSGSPIFYFDVDIEE